MTHHQQQCIHGGLGADEPFYSGLITEICVDANSNTNGQRQRQRPSSRPGSGEGSPLAGTLPQHRPERTSSIDELFPTRHLTPLSRSGQTQDPRRDDVLLDL